ncbi:30S ribosomal protein S8 [candidate division KSB1 bacterium]|nr:30S ribosomal protein S8 [candidate division KSB1 bacterium]
MSMTDPISDYLTRIRNAQKAGHKKVDIPASNIKRNITKILLQHKYVQNYINIDDGKQGLIRVYLKYGKDELPLIQGLRRISKPGRRVYVNNENLPRVLNNLGIAVMSTSQGVITNKEANKRSIGGEVLCYIW